MKFERLLPGFPAARDQIRTEELAALPPVRPPLQQPEEPR